MDDPGVWPDVAIVHAIHDRYLVEVVEQLGLCPFARRSRELGRVHRPIFRVAPDFDPARVGAAVAELAAAHPDAEIVLPTFLLPPGHRFEDAERFAAIVADVRAGYERHGGRTFFMVAFHPGFAPATGPHRRETPEALVPLLRRSPDPVIQCVDGGVLERARATAQQRAMTRLRERFAHDPGMLALLERSIQTDSELSAEIARTNFEQVGTGSGRAELERRIADILADRDRRYAACRGGGDPRYTPAR
ncbi:MAG: hypothetical protein K1X88_13735 [Nannocystaceae bacterium]|nr:hypothetical protein [Nannocystaceae bacterium]